MSNFRAQIDQADTEIIGLLARRMELVAQIAAYKHQRGLPVYDPDREGEIARRNARLIASGPLDEDFVVAHTGLVTNYAKKLQEELLSSRRETQSDRLRIMIIGAAGHMGQWLGRFFQLGGHEILGFDLLASDGPWFKTKQADPFEFLSECDYVVLATTISATEDLLDSLVEARCPKPIVEICSLKSSLISSIEKGLELGVDICSVHPMFGPNTDGLVGKNIVFCKTSPRDTSGLGRRLFSGTAAKCIEIPLADHDRFAGYLLGLSHMVNLLFAGGLSRSGLGFAELLGIASTTFLAQSEIAGKVSNESPNLYYEIQTKNECTGEVLRALREAFASLTSAIENQQPEEFAAYMKECQTYFNEGQS